MRADLLPANSTGLEQELARLSGSLDELDPSVIATIWDAWACPRPLLPFLAWALSVDSWDDAWDEVTKRQMIADSPAYHERKGTRGAVETAMLLMRCPTRLTEWHEATPEGRRGTARIFADISAAGGPAAAKVKLARLKRLVADAKPKSRAVWCGVGEASAGPVRIGVGTFASRTITIQPYAVTQPPALGQINTGVGLFIRRTLTIGA